MRLSRNFTAVTIAQLVAQVLTFILSVTIARKLGASSYGLFVFGFAFPSLFLLLVSAGLDEVIAIDVAADRSRAQSYLTHVAAMRLPLLAAAFTAFWLSVTVVLTDPLARNLTLILGVSALFQTYGGTFLAFFRAFERLEYTAFVIIVERGFTIAGAFLLMLSGYGLLEIALVFLAGGVISLSLGMAILRWKFTWFSRGWDPRTAVGILRKTVPFALGAVLSTFVLSSGPVLLTVLRNTSDAGLFNSGLTLLLIVLTFLTLAHVVLLPTLARIRAVNPERLTSIVQDTQRFFFAIGLPTAVGAAVYAQPIVTLFFGPNFAAAGVPFRILMVAVAISSACIGNGAALGAVHHQTENLYVGTLGAVALLVLSLMIIPSYGPSGAAVAFVTGWAITGVLGTVVTRRYAVRVNLVSVLGRPLLAGAMMALLLSLLPLPLLVGVPLGALVYVTSLYAIGGVQRSDWRLLRDVVRGALGRAG